MVSKSRMSIIVSIVVSSGSHLTRVPYFNTVINFFPISNFLLYFGINKLE